MSFPTWKDCFDYLIRYGRIGGLLPFLPQTKFNIFLSRSLMFMEMFLGVRMFMTVIYLEKGYFLGMMFFIYVVNIFTRVLQIYICAKEYEEYFDEVNDFLRENESNPITQKKNHFIEIWLRKRPRKFALSLLISNTILVFVWYGITVHGVAVASENASPLYWSPLFVESTFMRWFWGVHEIFPAFTMTYMSWYLNVTFTSLVTFQYAQLQYVKELATAMTESGNGRDTIKNMAWWLRTHQKVLYMTNKVTNLLGLHALSSYFAQLLFLVFSIVLLLFKNVTQSESQKIMCLYLGISHVLEFGYNCITVDRWEDMQNKLRHIVFTQKLMEGDKWRLSAYKIFMTRAAKPLVFTGYSFVVLNSATFRGMMMNVFSLYTSLRSILKSKAN